jgi:hypothetical protein
MSCYTHCARQSGQRKQEQYEHEAHGHSEKPLLLQGQNSRDQEDNAQRGEQDRNDEEWFWYQQ